MPALVSPADDDVYRDFPKINIVVTTESADPEYEGDTADAVTVYIRGNEDPLVGVFALPAGTTGGMLDIGLPPGQESIEVGYGTLVAVCEVGTPITGGCTLHNALGVPMTSSWVIAFLRKVFFRPLSSEYGGTSTEIGRAFLSYDGASGR